MSTGYFWNWISLFLQTSHHGDACPLFCPSGVAALCKRWQCLHLIIRVTESQYKTLSFLSWLPLGFHSSFHFIVVVGGVFARRRRRNQPSSSQCSCGCCDWPGSGGFAESRKRERCVTMDPKDKESECIFDLTSRSLCRSYDILVSCLFHASTTTTTTTNLGYAIPAVNCVSSSGINACLEAAARNKAPVIIQFSSGGAQVSFSYFLFRLPDFDEAILGRR